MKIEGKLYGRINKNSEVAFNDKLSDGTLWEGQTALYFRWIYLPDCAVPELAAGSRRDDRKLS